MAFLQSASGSTLPYAKVRMGLKFWLQKIGARGIERSRSGLDGHKFESWIHLFYWLNFGYDHRLIESSEGGDFNAPSQAYLKEKDIILSLDKAANKKGVDEWGRKILSLFYQPQIREIILSRPWMGGVATFSNETS